MLNPRQVGGIKHPTGPWAIAIDRASLVRSTHTLPTRPLVSPSLAKLGQNRLFGHWGNDGPDKS